jgi:hypothetical protein
MSLKDFMLHDSVAVTPFVRVTLRTSEIAAARAFYAALLRSVELEIAPLPKAAAGVQISRMRRNPARANARAPMAAN